MYRVNIPAEMAAVTVPIGERDELLVPNELEKLSLFETLTDPENMPSFKKFPNTTVLRHCKKGQVLCHLGDAGATAFYILTTKDVIGLRESQLKAIDAIPVERNNLAELERKFAAKEIDETTFDKQLTDLSNRVHLYFWQDKDDEDELLRRRSEIEKELETLRGRQKRIEEHTQVLSGSASDQDKRAAQADLRGETLSAHAVFTIGFADDAKEDDAGNSKEKRLLGRVARMLNFSKPKPAHVPKFISIDAVQDIETKTNSAPMLEGDLFGEMSCMNRQPRSAAVVAARDCYMLEMLRNVLDTLHSDDGFRVKMDATYRERVLENHLRRLPIFQDLTDDEFKDIQKVAKLIEVPAGNVIFEEREPADSFYVIRNGLVKVVRGAWNKVQANDFSDPQWNKLCQELHDGMNGKNRLATEVWNSLAHQEHKFRDQAKKLEPPGEKANAAKKAEWAKKPDAVKKANAIRMADAVSKAEAKRTVADAFRKAVVAIAQPATDGAKKRKITEEEKSLLVQGLNELVILGGRTAELKDKNTTKAVALLHDQTLIDAVRDYPEKTENWSEIEVRNFNRLLLEQACPGGMPRRRDIALPRRTLKYDRRGDFFGEMGVLLDQPRSATTYAYDHPDGGASNRLPDAFAGAVPSRVELVRIAADDFRKLLTNNVGLRARIQKVVDEYQADATQAKYASALPDHHRVAGKSADFEQMGLIEGTHLMLINLDRCTRCNQCVEACVSSHSDGHTRLYLDGPRFENYLVPVTCRSCVDPVCMINCPVGSINRGRDGEIVIENWCIGCSLCETQCPYGSIKMTELPKGLEVGAMIRAILPAGAEIKDVKERAVVCDLCHSLPRPSCVDACPHDAAMRVDAQQYF
jgi:Fe-S-cluster-containing hydrogenase component 2/CRP-like cAMP-binding protein